MGLIWLQSSHFDPKSIYALTPQISYELLLIIGIGFELFHLFQFGILYLLFVFFFLVLVDLIKA